MLASVLRLVLASVLRLVLATLSLPLLARLSLNLATHARAGHERAYFAPAAVGA